MIGYAGSTMIRDYGRGYICLAGTILVLLVVVVCMALRSDAPVVADRYCAVDCEERGLFVIYDKRNEDAWIESDYTVPLAPDA